MVLWLKILEVMRFGQSPYRIFVCVCDSGDEDRLIGYNISRISMKLLQGRYYQILCHMAVSCDDMSNSVFLSIVIFDVMMIEYPQNWYLSKPFSRKINGIKLIIVLLLFMLLQLVDVYSTYKNTYFNTRSVFCIFFLNFYCVS